MIDCIKHTFQPAYKAVSNIENWKKVGCIIGKIVLALLAALVAYLQPPIFFLGLVVGIVFPETVDKAAKAISEVFHKCADTHPWMTGIAIVTCSIVFLDVTLLAVSFTAGAGVGRWMRGTIAS